MLEAHNGLNRDRGTLYLPRGRESMLLLVDCDDPHVCTESYTVSVIYHTNYCYLTS